MAAERRQRKQNGTGTGTDLELRGASGAGGAGGDSLPYGAVSTAPHGTGLGECVLGSPAGGAGGAESSHELAGPVAPHSSEFIPNLGVREHVCFHQLSNAFPCVFTAFQCRSTVNSSQQANAFTVGMAASKFHTGGKKNMCVPTMVPTNVNYLREQFASRSLSCLRAVCSRSAMDDILAGI